MADRYAAQCNLVGVCIDDRKQCNSVTGGVGDVNPEMITVSSASTHRDVVDQANLVRCNNRFVGVVLVVSW